MSEAWQIAPVRNYRRFKVSAKARDLAVLVYEITSTFPGDERYGMTSQLRRAAVSIGLAIAEGCGRLTIPDLIRFLTIANGSAQEVEYGAELSTHLGLAPSERLRPAMDRAVELQKMLSTLIKTLRTGQRRA